MPQSLTLTNNPDPDPILTAQQYDHWSMPQSPRSPREQVQFDHMLWRMDRLFLATPVLILLDLSYLSRFWVRDEA